MRVKDNIQNTLNQQPCSKGSKFNMRVKSKDQSEVKSSVIRLRLTQAEAEMFKTKAKEAGCKSISEYIRVRCIDESVKTDTERQE